MADPPATRASWLRRPHRPRMAPQQRAALVSVFAAAGLVAAKLIVGLLAHSLALIAEAVHSATDLVAAVLTFFAVGVAVRPADRDHPYGHGKAEHLSALAEGSVLVLASVFIAYESLHRLTAGGSVQVDARWYTFATLGGVLVVDAGRTLSSRRASRRYRSAALAASSWHFAGDLVGTSAVLIGLVLVRAGHPAADAIAALVVAVLVLLAAGRIMLANVSVLMDTLPASAEHAARQAIEGITPHVDLRRLRIRQAGGRYFADVVVAVEPDAGVGQAHAVASAIEEAIERDLPRSDVVVHVEPQTAGAATLRERATIAAASVPGVREVHNVTALDISGAGPEVALHLKLPSELSLGAAHEIVEHVEAAIHEAAPEVSRVQVHIEPLTGAAHGRAVSGRRVREVERLVRSVVREVAAVEPAELRFRRTDAGLITFVTLRLAAGTGLVDAHARASEIEQRVRAARPEIADVVIHTEPG